LFPQLLLSECKSQLSIIVGHLSSISPHWHLGRQISDGYTVGAPANGALNGLGQLKIQFKLSQCSVIIMDIMDIIDTMNLGLPTNANITTVKNISFSKLWGSGAAENGVIFKAGVRVGSWKSQPDCQQIYIQRWGKLYRSVENIETRQQ